MPFLSIFNKKPIDFTFDQAEVLNNMEFYLRKKGNEETEPVSKKSRYELADKIKKTNGFCHGFALYFLDVIIKDLKSKDSNFLHDHFSNLQKISSWDRKKNIDHDLEMVFEKVIAHVNWLQDPQAYHSSASQTDVEILMEGDFLRDRSYYDVFSVQSFTDFLRKHSPTDRPILIESPSHTTALYRDGDDFYCRDPNDPLGLRKIYFKDIDAVAHFYFEQFKQFYPGIEEPFQLPIIFNIYKTVEQESCNLETYEEYVANKKTAEPEFALKKGAGGATALWMAVKNKDSDAAKMLIELGADPNAYYSKYNVSVLNAAILTEQFDVASSLLKIPNIDVNFADSDGITPLINAVYFRANKTINELFLVKNIDVNRITKDGETALHIALKRNNVALVDKLLARDADILVKKEGGKSPLEIVLDKCLDDKKEKRDKINDIAMLENLLNKSPNTSELREACFDTLSKNKNLFLPKNQDAAFLLMDKHTGFDLFLCVSSFLSVPSTSKVANKTSWTSMFKKQPVENDAIFEKMLQEKINRSDLDVNSPTVLNDVIGSVLEDCAKQSLYFSKDFQSRLDFTTNYLQHRGMLEQFQPKAIESQSIKSS